MTDKSICSVARLSTWLVPYLHISQLPPCHLDVQGVDCGRIVLCMAWNHFSDPRHQVELPTEERAPLKHVDCAIVDLPKSLALFYLLDLLSSGSVDDREVVRVDHAQRNLPGRVSSTTNVAERRMISRQRANDLLLVQGLEHCGEHLHIMIGGTATISRDAST